ncbi:MAG: NAD-dependent succinate-semialdehyde dehydrogenase [Myxococcales bacterium]
MTESFAALFPRSLDDVPPEHRLEPIEQREWLVGGELRTWEGPVQRVRSVVCAGPDLQRVDLGSTPQLGAAEALAALDAADRAWDLGRGAWPTMPVAERIRCVEELARRLAERREEVARILMWEVGKAWTDALKEVDRTVSYIRDTVTALMELDRRSAWPVVEQGVFGQIRRAPLGPTLCMGPFNYPLNETFTTLVPALIMGNPVIFKPPKLGVLLHRPLLEAFRDAFPPGVVNTVHGDGSTVVGPLMQSGRLACLAFIGSSRVAGILKHQHPKPHRLRAVLGLDAKNAAIVLPDADLDLTARECVTGALTFNGQRCTALKLLFVHRSIAEPLLERMAAGIDALRGGMPWEPGVGITPLAEDDKAAWLGELVAEAVASGGRVVNRRGGESAGTYFQPALVCPVAPSTRLWRVEQFGPVVPVVPYDDVEEPLRHVVESDFGQQVSLFGQDPATLGALIDPLVNQVCRVNLNTQCQRGPDTFPFTGRKDSAEGTLSVSDALRVFSIRSLVAARADDAGKETVQRILRARTSKFLSTDFLM